MLLTEDRVVPVGLQRQFATRAQLVAEFTSLRSPFLSRTAELADLLLELADA